MSNLNILHVAEKPSVASSISFTLGQGNLSKINSLSKFNPNHTFKKPFRNYGNCQHIII